MASKWLELLTEIAPGVKQVGMMFNPDTATYLKSFYLPSGRGRGPNAWRGDRSQRRFVATPKSKRSSQRSAANPEVASLRCRIISTTCIARSIIARAARNNIPAVYQEPESARDGGLLSSGAGSRDIFRRAAGYVDRVLRGAEPAELPVQLPGQIRDGHQSEDRQSAWARGGAIDPAARRRGDRIACTDCCTA